MNQIKAILETLKDLDRSRASALFDELIHTPYFRETFSPDNTAMFIFPDGRILSSADTHDLGKSKEELEVTELMRDVYHNDINDYLPKDILHPDDKFKYRNHPAWNTNLSKYYNLIIVAVGHEVGTLMIPYGVEPTPEQQERIDEFIDAGFRLS